MGINHIPQIVFQILVDKYDKMTHGWVSQLPGVCVNMTTTTMFDEDCAFLRTQKGLEN